MQRILILVSALIAAACGAVLGILFTIAHRASVVLVGVDVPYGIALGLVSIVAFLIAMRLLWETRWPTVGGAIGFVGAIGVLSFGGVGGSVIVGNDGYGWAWLITSILAAAIVVAWPRRRVHSARSTPEGAEPDDTIEEPQPHGRGPAEESL